MRRLVSSVLVIGLAVGGGYLLGSTRAQGPVSAPAARAPTERSVVVAADRGLSEADLRRVVKEEMAASDPGTPRAREPAPATPAPGNPVAFDDGMRRVNRAIAQRQWTREDASALGRTLDSMSTEQRTTLLRTLIPALNRGEIKLTYRGEVF